MKKIIASGPVIVEEGKLLVNKDNKDDFYKIPGGRIDEGENLEQACIREVKEEINADIKIIKKLPTMKLDKNPQTGELFILRLVPENQFGKRSGHHPWNR